MPRIKQPPVAPTTSLAGFSLAFTDLKRANIPLHHDDLATKTFAQLEDEIQQAGGSVVTKIAPESCTHLVATGEQYHKKGARIKDAIKHNIPIVIYDWLAISLESNDVVDVADFLLQSRSSSPPASEDVAQTNGRSSRSGKRARDEDDDQDGTDSVTTKKIKAEDEHQKADVKADPTKNGTEPAQKAKIQMPVDEHYPEERCKVYQDDEGVIYDATLNQTESGKNANKFYRVQLLQHDSGQFYTWTRWGRVGDSPGQSKMLGNGSVDLAIAEFEKKFKDKTGLAWKDRDAAPKPKKYTMIEINYEESDGDDDDLPGAGHRRDSHVSSASSESVETKLSEPVARLMSLIFNNDFFNNTLAELDYDAFKMPLGKLSKKTLLKGYEVLKDLASRIGQTGPAPGEQTNVNNLSDQYFSLIPHAFHRGQRPPVLSSMDLIKREVTLLENLTDMQ